MLLFARKTNFIASGTAIQTIEAFMPTRFVLVAMLSALTASGAVAADRFLGFNETTATVFTGVYFAPAGTTGWGPNEALNDKDKTWESGERLAIKGVSRGTFDLKLIDQAGHVCIKHGLDLSKDTTFEIRDQDLADCRK
jgi:hypothetical protein